MAEHGRLGCIVRTTCLIFVWITLGMYLEINGSALHDLAYRTGVGYERVSLALSGADYGMLAGAVISGLLVERVKRWLYLLISCFLFIAAAAVATIPWMQSFEAIAVLSGMLGLTVAAINTCGSIIILQMWKEKASAPLHILHMGFGIGSFVVPQICSPFLSPSIVIRTDSDIQKCQDLEKEAIQNNTSGNGTQLGLASASTFTTSDVLSFTQDSSYITKDPDFVESRIEYAYGIVSAAVLVMMTVFVILQVIERWLDKRQLIFTDTEQDRVTDCAESLKRTFCPAESCVKGARAHAVLIMLLVILFYFLEQSSERQLGRFMYSFARDEMCFSVSKATWLSSSFWISFSVGRFVGFLAALVISMRVLLLVEGIVLVTVISLWVAFGFQYSIALWVIVQATGFILGPVYPSALAWTNRHIEVKGLMMTLVQFGSSLAGLITWLTGRLFETHGPRAFVYLILGLSCLSLVNTVVMILVGKRFGERFSADGKPAAKKGKRREKDRMEADQATSFIDQKGP